MTRCLKGCAWFVGTMAVSLFVAATVTHFAFPHSSLAAVVLTYVSVFCGVTLGFIVLIFAVFILACLFLEGVEALRRK